MLVNLITRQDLLDYVSENSGQEVDVSTMFKIRDPLICEVKISYSIKSIPSLSNDKEKEKEPGIEIDSKVARASHWR